MNIVFRTDASIQIGTGHVMRCLTLAKQLQRHGAEVTFICRNLVGNSIAYLQSQNVEVLSLPRVEDSINDLEWIADSWQQDAKGTASFLKQLGCKVDVLVVDHYSLDKKWEEELDNLVGSIFVIDDLANRHHTCDFLLDQNYYNNMRERYVGLVPDECVLLLGPDYVLLRDEFIEAANRPRIRSGKVENLLIFFGGTDPTGETIKVLEAIKELDQQFKNIDVVVGASNPNKEQVEELCEIVPNTQFLCQVNNMAELMMKADLAIGAGGATTWERCLVGLPTLAIVVAENQLELTEVLAARKVLINLGTSCRLLKEDIKKEIIELMTNPSKLLLLNKRSQEIINTKVINNYPVILKIKENYNEPSA
ncbi:UDP-2,4-diacetamido-2,4,6-trideoxy-beta-L-altropyranose hydrolase [Sporosarcina cascadiensis]|uniref:UDP-2,4-diacetamido-2,4, 6-trideoxy-beta-L-altropyranose hydrolase n=1 Tax=Sporosarcina cascadiensis TaxID=2660747 RepID=UPI00129BE6FE|nr:UDP-2,4-diacetamido-2,4,6-trideoxy-beta-L-altropyranose hydrolase [Sporosarcina cascadiensis]